MTPRAMPGASLFQTLGSVRSAPVALQLDGRLDEALTAQVGAADPDRDRRRLAAREDPVVAGEVRVPTMGSAIARRERQRVEEATDQDPPDPLSDVPEDLEERARPVGARARGIAPQVDGPVLVDGAALVDREVQFWCRDGRLHLEHESSGRRYGIEPVSERHQR